MYIYILVHPYICAQILSVHFGRVKYSKETMVSSCRRHLLNDLFDMYNNEQIFCLDVKIHHADLMVHFRENFWLLFPMEILFCLAMKFVSWIWVDDYYMFFRIPIYWRLEQQDYALHLFLS